MRAMVYTLIPWVALVVGAIATVIRPPGPKVRSAIQHFAAGVVFAAAASEILPDVKHGGSVVAVAIGAGLGIVVMLVIKQIGRWAKGPLGMAAVTGIDILIDGLVLGIGFAAGARQGLLLTVALTIEVLFLGLTLTGQFIEKIASRWKAASLTVLIGFALPLGAAAGGPVGSLSAPLLTGFYAFGLIALLYLVTEELLVEAHEQTDTPLISAMFFVGFMLLLLLEEALP